MPALQAAYAASLGDAQLPQGASTNGNIPCLVPIPARSYARQAGSHGKQENEGIDAKPDPVEGFITATFDLDANRTNRLGWVAVLGGWAGVWVEAY